MKQLKALEILNNDNMFDESYVSENNYQKLINEAISELQLVQDIILEKDEALAVERLLFKNKLEALDSDLKDLFSCIELFEDENAEKRLSNMETYLIKLARHLK